MGIAQKTYNKTAAAQPLLLYPSDLNARTRQNTTTATSNLGGGCQSITTLKGQASLLYADG